MAESSDYNPNLVYPDKWTPPVSAAIAAPPTVGQVEAFLKTLLSKPIEKQVVIEAVLKRFQFVDWTVARALVEEVEKKWHPVKY